MFQPVKVLAVDIDRPLQTVGNLKGYGAVFALVRVCGLSVGTVKVPVRDGRCEAGALGKAILAQHWHKVVRRLIQRALRSPVPPGGFHVKDLLVLTWPEPPMSFPLVTVAVCTRDRTTSLSLSLDALTRLNYPALDLLVVDNAPSGNATEHLVREHFPTMRYVREDRPGLDWARNRAIQEAYGDIIAFTDDDAVVDPNWVQAIVRVFHENPEVMAVTGLVLPYELETEAQLTFEEFGGFARGFERQWYRVKRGNGKPDTFQIGAGRFGTGANMAFRKKVFDLIGGFDPALDVGTVTNGGGDLEMFFRVLQEGHPLVYEPAALVWHRHRREYAELKRQIHTWGIGLYSYFVRSALVYQKARPAIVRFGLWHFWWRYLRQLTRWTLLMEPGLHLDLLLAELKGVFLGLFRYQQARVRAVQIIKAFGSLSYATLAAKFAHAPACPPPPRISGVRLVNLSEPLRDMTDVTDCSSVSVFVSWQDRVLGHVLVANHHQVISADHLREAIANRIGVRLFDPQGMRSHNLLKAETLAALTEHYLRLESQTEAGTVSRLSKDLSTSIVVATYDRPQSLRTCLRNLVSLDTTRPLEIVVVDNHPSSNLTPPVVAEFPGVVFVVESRQGLAYARNAGIRASRGDIVVATDDDVVVPPGWLERLVAPFADGDVMVVTGNVLPGELDTRAQTLFEAYGGLGRGYESFEADGNWFASFGRRAVPTWRLGATANAAFRATVFSHPEIGLFDEALGAGTPTGCSEDTYLFYKVLKAGYRIVYKPHAYVWHMHRREMRSLRRQLYNYSKGHSAYHLTTLLRDRDPRALTRLLVELPLCHVRRALARIRGWSDYPLSLIGIEVIGNLVGPVALWRARRRVKRLGMSNPYIPVSERTGGGETLQAVEKYREAEVGV